MSPKPSVFLFFSMLIVDFQVRARKRTPCKIWSPKTPPAGGNQHISRSDIMSSCPPTAGAQHLHLCVAHPHFLMNSSCSFCQLEAFVSLRTKRISMDTGCFFFVSTKVPRPKNVSRTREKRAKGRVLCPRNEG